jgi:hypothetical protein
LSTRTIRAAVVCGAGRLVVVTVPRCQSPNAFSTSGRSSAAEIRPDTTSAALLGTKFFAQNARMSAAVIARFDASVPSSV